jgi:hypothetical protein
MVVLAVVTLPTASSGGAGIGVPGAASAVAEATWVVPGTGWSDVYPKHSHPGETSGLVVGADPGSGAGSAGMGAWSGV